MNNEHILIDSPITPYSSEQEIKDWLNELSKMPQDNKQVKKAIKIAEKALREKAE
jgi:hypothetical protein